VVAGGCSNPGGVHHEGCEYQDSSNDQDRDDGQNEADI
jgi:hypothetical protein